MVLNNSRVIQRSGFYLKKFRARQCLKLLQAIIQITSIEQLKSIPRLAQMYEDLGKDDVAKRMLQTYITRLEPIARDNPTIFEIWLVIVRCATMTKDYDQAREIIQDAVYQTVRDQTVRERLIRLLANVSVQEADNFDSVDDLDSYKGRLFALCNAIRTDPRSREAYVRLIDYAAPETLVEEKAIWLRDSIIGCPNPAVIHVILGIQDIKDGNFVQGQKHWRIADQQFDLAQYIVNNMIELAISEKPDTFGNALDMITVALELFPEQAALYQTRGLYYKNNQEYDNAIKDLEYAVEKIPTLIPARQMLMECYEATGNEEKVTETQVQINEMIRKLDDAQRAAVQAFLDRQNAKE